MNKLRLSGSSMDRWSKCYGSPYLIEAIGERYKLSKDDSYAGEGTTAHSYAEKVLKGELKLSEVPKDFDDISPYVESVFEYALDGYELGFEVKVSASEKFNLNGTCDAYALNVDKKHLVIFDLKYGIGIRKSAYDNDQLKFYACGVIETLKLHGKIDKITLIISQPRVTDELSTYDMTYEEIMQWLQDELLYSAEKVYKVGSQCRFCDAKLGCSSFKEEIKNIAKTPLNPSTLGKILDLETVVNGFFADAKRLATELAKSGMEIEGYSLQESIGNRQWTVSVDELSSTLKDLGSAISSDDIVETKLVSPAVLEKIIKSNEKDKTLAKKLKDEILPELTIRPSRGSVLKKGGKGDSAHLMDLDLDVLDEL